MARYGLNIATFTLTQYVKLIVCHQQLLPASYCYPRITSHRPCDLHHTQRCSAQRRLHGRISCRPQATITTTLHGGYAMLCAKQSATDKLFPTQMETNRLRWHASAHHLLTPEDSNKSLRGKQVRGHYEDCCRAVQHEPVTAQLLYCTGL